jgi:energy-coupling factor transport system ATP-binding protein
MDGLAIPDSGSVVSFGMDTSDRSIDLRQLRMRAPLAVQRPESAIFEAYAADEVAFGPRNQGLRGQELVARVSNAMDTVGLQYSQYRDASTRALSGGMKRKLALASILSLDPDALLLDEPTAALDPTSRAKVLDIITTFARPEDDENGSKTRPRTLVMSTHSMDEAAIADMVAVMKEGRIVAYGPPRSVFGSQWDPSWGIERPFSYELQDALAVGSLP